MPVLVYYLPIGARQWWRLPKQGTEKLEQRELEPSSAGLPSLIVTWFPFKCGNRRFRFVYYHGVKSRWASVALSAQLFYGFGPLWKYL